MHVEVGRAGITGKDGVGWVLVASLGNKDLRQEW
jgi:hypothetical protein